MTDAEAWEWLRKQQRHGARVVVELSKQSDVVEVEYWGPSYPSPVNDHSKVWGRSLADAVGDLT